MNKPTHDKGPFRKNIGADYSKKDGYSYDKTIAGQGPTIIRVGINVGYSK